MMKIRHKKIVASGTAVVLAGILGVGALLQSSVSVQASPAMMPGIEQIVNDTTAEKPFKILEISPFRKTFPLSAAMHSATKWKRIRL